MQLKWCEVNTPFSEDQIVRTGLRLPVLTPQVAAGRPLPRHVTLKPSTYNFILHNLHTFSLYFTKRSGAERNNPFHLDGAELMLRPRSSRHVASALLGSPTPNISLTCGSPAPPAPSPQSSSYIPIASNMPTSCGTGARAPRARPIQYSVTVPPSDLVASGRSVPRCSRNPIPKSCATGPRVSRTPGFTLTPNSECMTRPGIRGRSACIHSEPADSMHAGARIPHADSRHSSSSYAHRRACIPRVRNPARPRARVSRVPEIDTGVPPSQSKVISRRPIVTKPGWPVGQGRKY